jgi:hypothetical protein
MTYIPQNLNTINLTEFDIQNYYSLDPVDEFDGTHKKRLAKIINEFVTYQNGGTFTSIESQKQKKKRLMAFTRDKPKNSKVFIAFNSWRKGEINKHIMKQMKQSIKSTATTVDESDDKMRIKELEELLKERDTEIRKLNNKIMKLRSDKPAQMPNAVKPNAVVSPQVAKVKVVEVVAYDKDDNPYDNTSEKEALEIYNERVNKKADHFVKIVDDNPERKSDTQLLNEAYEFIHEEIDLIQDIQDDLEYHELFKKF